MSSAIEDSVRKQVFLGGACGASNWRRTIAIPVLEAAGITYFDPQLGAGEWTPARESIEMQAKDAADVLLFVISEQTRGVASIGEVGYLLGCHRPLALVVNDIGPDDTFEGKLLSATERDDINRGRIFVRSMAAREGVPVFVDVADAVRHAVALVRERESSLTAERLRAILSEIRFQHSEFLVEEGADGFWLRIRAELPDAGSGVRQTYCGRKWHIPRLADESEVVRTAFLAAITWQEHEVREAFTFRGVPVFGAHADVRDLARLATKDRRKS